MKSLGAAMLSLLVSAAPATAQHEHHDAGPPAEDREHAVHAMMPALLGPYDAAQDASGTAWQPSASGHEGIHTRRGAWSFMLHGPVAMVADHQGGDRGDDRLFAASMLMARAVRPVGPGTLGLRAMISLDPATIGRKGYPLLLQTGETADGVEPLIDRQHPHDLFMELAASYALIRGNHSLFAYGGFAGEPALGPPVFMHRRSGVDIPEAPISHHWLDSSHITFGVLTAGGTWGAWKLEGSAFRGREPDEERWDLEEPRLDSHSFRLSFNPTPGWALQGSFGRLESPEELHPGVDTDRFTASAIWNRATPGGNWQTTFAWGRNRNRPGRILDALLLESALSSGPRHTFLGRAEVAEKDELFEEGDPLEGRKFTVGKVGFGYVYEALQTSHLGVGVGGYATVSIVGDELAEVYGNTPPSGMLFLRVKLR